jgi:hypothetical protein
MFSVASGTPVDNCANAPQENTISQTPAQNAAVWLERHCQSGGEVFTVFHLGPRKRTAAALSWVLADTKLPVGN